MVTSPTEETNSRHCLAISVVWVITGETHFSSIALRVLRQDFCDQGGRLMGGGEGGKDIKGIAFSRKSIQELLGVPYPGIFLLGPWALPTL